MLRFALKSLFCLILSVCLLANVSNAKLVGYWSFDEKGNLGKDYSGMGNNGKLEGNARWTEKGKEKGALLCDGQSWIEVPDSDSLTMDKELTMMCWVNFSETGNFYQGLAFKDGPNDNNWASYTLRVYRSEGKWGGIAFDCMTEGWVRINLTHPQHAPDTNKWYHIVGILDGNTMRLFVNGEEVDPKKSPTANINQNGKKLAATKEPLLLGKDHWGNGLRGVLDEVAIFNETLNESQLKNIMEKGVAAGLALESADKLTSAWGRLKMKD